MHLWGCCLGGIWPFQREFPTAALPVLLFPVLGPSLYITLHLLICSWTLLEEAGEGTSCLPAASTPAKTGRILWMSPSRSTAHPLLPVSICGVYELQLTILESHYSENLLPHLIPPGFFFSLHSNRVTLSCAHTNATAGDLFSWCPSSCGHLSLPSGSFLGLHWHGSCTAAAPDWQECLIQASIPDKCKSILFFPVQW